MGFSTRGAFDVEASFLFIHLNTCFRPRECLREIAECLKATLYLTSRIYLSSFQVASLFQYDFVICFRSNVTSPLPECKSVSS